MIRKFLVCGKRQCHLQSKNMDAFVEMGRVVELLMPVQDFWALEDEIKKSNYLVASGESPATITSVYRKILGMSSQFAVREIDRVWLYGIKKES